MNEVTLVLGPFEGEVVGDVIGVDRGAAICLERNIPMIKAVGDFDSISNQEMEALKASNTAIEILPAMKDDTDFYYAYKQCSQYDRILVLGGLGRRRDHEYSNIIIAMQDSRVELRDQQNHIKRYDCGSHILLKNDYKYLSFIVFQPITISISGVKYPLTERYVEFGETYLTSNEIIDERAYLELHGNPVLVIQSKDLNI